MHSNVERDGAYTRDLMDFVRREYAIDATGIAPAKRGYFGETWRLDAADRAFFVKLDYSDPHRFIYERSFPVVEHLGNHGIDCVSRIVKTARGQLSTRHDGAVLGVFDWIDGENIESDDTKGPEFQMLAKVYAVPTEGLAIPVEDFSGHSADRFFAQWSALADEGVRSLLDVHRDMLELRAARLRHFALRCRGDRDGFFITHGDAGGNLIVGAKGAFIVDWDDPILAPPERDAWNMLCCRDWAGDLFHRALRDNGIGYTLRPERLAYYCYFSYFYYLTEHLDEFAQTGAAEGLAAYFSGWAGERAAYADANF